MGLVATFRELWKRPIDRAALIVAATLVSGSVVFLIYVMVSVAIGSARKRSLKDDKERADAAYHGYVVWKSEDERRRELQLRVTDAQSTRP